MNHSIFKSHKKELTRVLGTALAMFLPPLFRTYHELRNRAGSSERVTIALDELASSLGYEVSRLERILQDLDVLDVIDYQPQKNTNGNRTITMLVR